jgi:hypothetical protein
MFKDGREVDLEQIKSVSTIRDLGLDKTQISVSRICFTVHLKNREELQVSREYHYSDWAEAKIELGKEREDLLNKWNEVSKK